jgi:hypothetical protein
MKSDQRKALEQELQEILQATNPAVPAVLDPNYPTQLSMPEIELEKLERLRKRRDDIQRMLAEADNPPVLRKGPRRAKNVRSMRRATSRGGSGTSPAPKRKRKRIARKSGRRR